MLELPVSRAVRAEDPGGKTSPEELIAAARASCFAMALAVALGENHTPPARRAVVTACTLDEVDGGPRITTVHLGVRPRVPNLHKEAGLVHISAKAAELCPVSNALRGGVQITVRDRVCES